MIRRLSPEQFFRQSQQEQELENILIEGEPVPPEPVPQIQYIPVAGVNAEKPEIPWGLIGVISIVGIVVVGIVAVVVAGG
ncbi:unnamed protein product, partial [marine sediment metagenome]